MLLRPLNSADHFTATVHAWRHYGMPRALIATKAHCSHSQSLADVESSSCAGVLISPDQSTYVGEWRVGQRHGHGCLRQADGTQFRSSLPWTDSHP